MGENSILRRKRIGRTAKLRARKTCIQCGKPEKRLTLFQGRPLCRSCLIGEDLPPILSLFSESSLASVGREKPQFFSQAEKDRINEKAIELGVESPKFNSQGGTYYDADV